MRANIISIPVLDQQHALEFYTEKLGFIKKIDAPLSGDTRWLTLVSPEDQDGVQLLLEPAPLHFEPSKVYQDALREAGIPWTQFDVDDCDKEYEKLKGLGVEFSMGPTVMGTSKFAVFSDTCGNNIQIVETL